MSVPNVGVTGVIQDPGLGGTIAAGLGDIAKFMVNLENIRAQNQAEQQRIALAKQAQDFAEQQAAAKLAEEQRLATSLAPGFAALAQGDRQAMDLKVAPVGGLAGLPLGAQIKTPAVDSVLRAFQAVQPRDQMAFAAAAKERLQAIDKMREPIVVGGDSRLMTQGGRQIAGVDRTLKASDNTGDLRDFLATHRLRPDTDPSTFGPEMAARYDAFLQRRDFSRAPKQTFNMGNSIAAAAIPKAMERVGGMADAASSAASDLETILELENLLNQGTKGGLTGNARLQLGRALVDLGWADDPSVANTEAYQALVGARVGQIIKQFGSGTGLSDADREYAEKMAGGRIQVTEAARRRLFAIAKRRAQAIIAESNKAAEVVPEELRGSFIIRDPTAARSTSAAPATGTANQQGYARYTDGKMYKMRLVGTQWVIDPPGVGPQVVNGAQP